MSVFLDRETLGAATEERGQLSPLPQGLRPARTPGRFAQGAKKVGASLVGTGLLLTVTLVAAERFAAVDWRPSSFLGAYGGRVESARVLTAIEAKRAEAAAVNEEQARAQQATVALQAENERVTKAYEALYQRGNQLAAAWAQGANQILALNAQQRMKALEGRAGVSNFKDNLAKWCDFASLFAREVDCGDQLRGSALNDRNAMSEEIIRDYENKVGRVAAAARAWAQGFYDPAEVIASLHDINKLHPLPSAPVPPAPLKSPSNT